MKPTVILSVSLLWCLFQPLQADPAAEAPVLKSYLASTPTGKIERVAVGASSVTISGKIAGAADDVHIADEPMELLVNDPARFATVIGIKPDASGKFSITVPRIHKRGELDHDRLLSRWEIVRKKSDGFESLSHGRYADEVDCRSPKLPPAASKTKKGLGGWSAGRFPEELKDLGISSVTVNMMIHSLVSLEAGPGLTPFQWQGRTYHARESVLEEFDKTFLAAAERKVMVSVILLVANPAKDGSPVVKMLGNSEASPEGIYSMPAVTTEEGISLYGAILNLAAERWSKPGGKHGRVHHWIMHNEVDAGWVWTNAGEKPDVVFMDLYQRSMRLADLISRQYDPNMKAFISLTHHWANKGEARWYGSKRLLELLSSFCKAEGDFPWALAYHPYPQDLTKPRTWEDEQATFSFNTDKITPKNLEVLDAYMKTSAMLHQGKPRIVHLSENGFNSPDYSEKSLEDQAAGMALAWKKIQNLSTIQAWQYHNWMDHRGEGGLKIGLRKFPDDAEDPAGKKPIWYLYEAFATPAEDKVAQPYLKTIGLRSWKDAIHGKKIR